MERISMRDRPYERNMDPAYIATVNDAYDDFFDDFYRGVPVLVVDTNDLNIVGNEADLAQVEARIRQSLAETPRQRELPLK
jgi:deoxyadenosine/deoxycytidine kinase